MTACDEEIETLTSQISELTKVHTASELELKKLTHAIARATKDKSAAAARVREVIMSWEIYD